MRNDTITAICYRNDGTYGWVAFRKGAVRPSATGSVLVGTDPIPPALTGGRAGLITLALPASQLVIRIMDLQLTDPTELASAVALQVDKFSPFPVEQMVYSYEVLQKTADQSKVLIAACQRSRVATAGEILRAAGSRIARVDCSSLGLWHQLQAAGSLAKESRETIVLVDANEVTVLIHTAGVLISLSGLGLPGDMDNQTVCEELGEELARLMLEADAEHGPAPSLSLVVISAEGEGASATFRAELERHLPCPVSCRPASVYPTDSNGIAARSMLPEVGTLLNLMPAEWRQDADLKCFHKRMLTIGSILLGGWLLLAAGGWGYLYWQQAQLVHLRSEEKRWLMPANEVRRLRLQVNLIERYRDRRLSSLECLREISRLQPQGVDLISFTYRKGDGIELLGEADSGALVLQFNERLNVSDLFLDVRAGTRTQTRQGRHRFSFEISLQGDAQ